jgi:hypothetical protein
MKLAWKTLTHGRGIHGTMPSGKPLTDDDKKEIVRRSVEEHQFNRQIAKDMGLNRKVVREKINEYHQAETHK